MAILGKVFLDLLSAAGVDPETEGLQPLTTSDIVVPDAVASSLRSNLLTVEAAKNDPTLKKHFTAQALNPVDKGLYEYLDAFGSVDQAELEAIKAETSTYRKQTMVLDLIKKKTAEASKAAGSGDGEKSAKLKEEIETLNRNFVALKEQHTNDLRQKELEMDKSIMDYALNAELHGKNYANDTLDKEVNAMVARQIIDRRMAQDGAAVVRKDGSMVLVRKDNPDLEYMVENKKVSIGDYFDRVLGESKMLKVSDPNPNPTPNGGGNGNGNIVHSPEGGKGTVPQAVVDDYQRQIDAYATQG